MSPFILAVLLSFVVSMVLGFVWYSPLVFGKKWMRLHGLQPDTKPVLTTMTATFSLQALATLFYVTAFTFVLAILIPVNAFSILICVLALYLGFALPVVAHSMLKTEKPKKVALQIFTITALYQLVQALVIGIIFWLVR